MNNLKVILLQGTRTLSEASKKEIKKLNIFKYVNNYTIE